MHEPRLRPEQEQLLRELVEIERMTTRGQRHPFTVSRPLSGHDRLRHPSLKDDKHIYFGDIEVLASYGLVNLSYRSGGMPTFDLMPAAHDYYQWLMRQVGEPLERMEQTVRRYLDDAAFRTRHPVAYQKWTAAEHLLWSDDPERVASSIGHLLRETMQAFASGLVVEFTPPNASTDASKTVDRIRAVLRYRRDRLGTQEVPFLDAILAYWGTVNDLVQRQEHGAQREGVPLGWQDSRRVVFQTLMIMLEVDESLRRVGG